MTAPQVQPLPVPKEVPRAIEMGFPIVEINRLAEPERNSFKPIYQMHKWFARRASCVFRAILLGALKPAVQADGSPTDLMAEFYRNHADDPDTQGKAVLDPFMGGGTTIVEALRLGCNVTGIDLNPVAWFIVKTEIEPVDLAALQAAFDRLAASPVAWNDGGRLDQTLLGLYRSEAAPGVEADVIYTFWVKHAICTDHNCRKEVPLFKDWLVAHKSVSVRYWRDVSCPACGKAFDWEVQPATLVAERAMMVDAPRGAAGEGRPTAAWTYAAEPQRIKRSRDAQRTELDCPCCRQKVTLAVPSDRKKERKKVALTVLLCPQCEAVWQWRGTLPDGHVACPACRHEYDPRRGNLPEKGQFQCSCGNRDKIIESIRLLPKDKRLPVRPYALQAYLPIDETTPDAAGDGVQASLFGDGADRQQPLSLKRPALPAGFLLPENGKFFRRFGVADKTRLIEAEQLWETHKDGLPWPRSEIPVGEKTKSGLLAHHYNHWHEMFAPRQLLALSSLLAGILDEPDARLQEMLLCAFFSLLEGSNLFARFKANQQKSETAKGVFARHDFQPKLTPCEDNVWGAETGKGFRAWFEIVIEGKAFGLNPSDNIYRPTAKGQELERLEDGSCALAEPATVFGTGERAVLRCQSSAELPGKVLVDAVITDPPYVGNVNYAELADFFYVWLRLALKARYPWFAPEYTEKAAEIVENRTRGKSKDDFYAGLKQVFARAHGALPERGLLVFTFHHTDQQGKIWEGLLETICDTGFEIAAVYPVHGEAESSLHLQDNENASYDLIHVCRKRREDPRPRAWAGLRQEVRRRARAELAAIEAGRYGGKPLGEPDVRLVCIGKCLELYSAHYGHVLDHAGRPLPLHLALQDISIIVDQLVTRDRPLPPELEKEALDALSYAWLRCLMPRRSEIAVDVLSKELRSLQMGVDELKNAGFVTRGRAGRGRSYEVRQPQERLQSALEALERVASRQAQPALFVDSGQPEGLLMADLWQALIALAEAGESVIDLLDKFKPQWPTIAAGLRYSSEARSDWAQPIARVLAVMEGTPLFRGAA